MNPAEDAAHRFQQDASLSDAEMLEVALAYISNQDSQDAWESHLEESRPKPLVGQWALFNDDTDPSIQRIDDESPDEYDDGCAMIDFVRELQEGEERAVEAAVSILTFHSGQSRDSVALQLAALSDETGWNENSKLELLTSFIEQSPWKDRCIQFLNAQANQETGEVEMHDTVLVPDPVPGTDDAWECEFEGRVIGFWDNDGTPMVRVKDMEDDVFDVEQHRVKRT